MPMNVPHYKRIIIQSMYRSYKVNLLKTRSSAMQSYEHYAAIIYGIFFGLIVIYLILFTFFIPIRDFALLLKSLFRMEIDTTIHGSSRKYTMNLYGESIDLKKSRCFRFHLSAIVGVLLAFITMTFVFGCVVTMEYFYSGDLCPSRPKDCFVFSNSFSQAAPIDQFICNPGETIQVSNSTSYRYVVCYGYDFGAQSTLDILNQLGICTGILSILSIGVIFVYRISYHIIGMIFIAIFCLGSLAILALLAISIIKPDFLRMSLAAIAMFMCGAVLTIRPFMCCYRDKKLSTSV